LGTSVTRNEPEMNSSAQAAPALTAKQLRAFVHTQAFKKPAAAYIAAKICAEVTRKEVDAYIEPIWASFGFTRDDNKTPITHSDKAYLTEDARLTEFYAACDRAHAERGHVLEPGYCPALIAKRKLTDAEREILKAMAAPLGFDFESLDAHWDVRSKMLDLITSLAMKVIQEERAAA